MPRQTPRPYQLRAIDAVRDHYRHGRRRVLLVAPTGAGKTTIAAEIIYRARDRGTRSVFLAHRRELIGQCSRRLAATGVDHGLVQGGGARWRPQLDVQVASVQALLNRLKSGVLERDAGLLIIDEAHRSTAATYSEIIGMHPKAAVLGLTATPVRQGGRGLGEIYDAMVLVAQPRELIADGYLMEPRIFSGFETPDLSKIHVRGGDYIETELSAAMNDSKLIGSVVDSWTKYVGPGKRAIVFGCSVEHSQEMAKALIGAGVKAAHLDGDTPLAERDRILDDFRSRRIEVVTNCAILTEGFDLPELDAIVLARPTKSVTLYLQMCGRVLRPAAGKGQALILDHGANVKRLGWPTVDRQWELHEGGGEPTAAAAVKNCPNCAATALASVRECPACGFVWEVEERPAVEVVDGELREVTADDVSLPKGMGDSPELRMTILVSWVKYAQRRGHTTGRHSFPGSAAHRFRERYGRWPTLHEKIEALRRCSGGAG